MDNNDPKIRFYSIEGKLLNDLDLDYNEKLDEQKEITPSSSFNRALKSVIEKDIDFLTKKLSEIVKEITKHLAFNGIIIEEKINDDINDINNVINSVEALTSNLIIDKEKIKISFFSANKKQKKDKIKKLDDSINFLSKCQSDIISISDEYNKLKERNESIGDISFDDENDTKDDNPLERTVNFYMKKEN